MSKSRDFVGIYKPRKAITGGAVMQLKLGSKRDCMFLEVAPQIRDMDDPKPYDWENQRLTIKLGPTDIGKLIAMFDGVAPVEQDAGKPDLELFHKNDKGNKVIKAKRQDTGFYFKFSAKEDGKTVQLAIPVSWDESVLLSIALKRAYEVMLGW